MPKGRKVYTPPATFLIMPARTSKRWLAISASAGASFNVGAYCWLKRMISITDFLSLP